MLFVLSSEYHRDKKISSLSVEWCHQLTDRVSDPRRVARREQGLGIRDGQEPRGVGGPVDAVDDDGGVRRKLVREVGDVTFGVILELLGVEPTPVLPLELVLTSNLKVENFGNYVALSY